MKPWNYILSYSIPFSAVIGLWFGGVWAYLTPVYTFVALPVLEVIIPPDNQNLTELEMESRKSNPFFDGLLYINVPLIFGILIYTLYHVSNVEMAQWELVGFIFSTGIVLGYGINVAHELGHRTIRVEQNLGKLLLLPSLYMHFFIEHNFGHHLHAATREDPATARYNQTVYSFWFTSVLRQYFSAWKIQLDLLKRENRSFFSIQNDMLWYVLFQISYLIGVLLIFGWLGLLTAVGCAVVGFLLLETINYIEHYGLLRGKRASGRYERVEVVHSWNSNHVMGRMVLYELTRHSDHHYKASKKYQLLNCYELSPQLPYGYPTSMVLALVPPVWFKLMNPRIPEEMKALAA